MYRKGNCKLKEKKNVFYDQHSIRCKKKKKKVMSNDNLFSPTRRRIMFNWAYVYMFFFQDQMSFLVRTE